jgi:hypothetical protein
MEGRASPFTQSLRFAVSRTRADGLYVMVIANVATMIPAAPGYLGTFDGAVLLGVSLVVSAGRSQALQYLPLLRFVLFVPITFAGLAAMFDRYGGLRALRAGAAQRESHADLIQAKGSSEVAPGRP